MFQWFRRNRSLHGDRCAQQAVIQVIEALESRQLMAATLLVTDNSGTTTDKSISFPSTALNATSAKEDFFLKNTGTTDLTITLPSSTTSFTDFNIDIKDPTNSSISSGTFTIHAGETYDVQVNFNPVTAAGARTGTLPFTTTDTNNASVTLNMSGNAASGPFLKLPSTSVGFTTTAVGSTAPTKTFSLINGDGQAVNVTSFLEGGTNTADFTYVVKDENGTVISGANASTPPTTFTIPAGKTYTVTATFAPTAAGARTGNVTFSTNDPGNATVTLTTGATATPAPTTTPAGTPTNFDAVADSSSQVTLTWTYNNADEQGFQIADATSANGNFSVATSVGAGVGTATIKNLLPGTHYFFRMAAFNAFGNGGVASTDVFTPTAADLAGSTAATAQSLGRLFNRVINGSVGDTDRIDTYAIKILNTGFLHTVLSGMTANANLDLFRIGSNGAAQFLVVSNHTGTHNEAFLKKLTPGVYYVRVRQGARGQNTNYTLTMTGNFAGDTRQTARKLGALRQRLGFVGDVGLDNKADYFSFTNSRRRNVTILLNDLQQDADLYLIDSHGRLLQSSEQDGSDSITRNLSAGLYFVKVLEANNASTSYHLTITPG